MRDDFDEIVADRFKLLDDVQVPDTWSKIQLRVRDERPASSANFLEQDLSFATLEAATPTSENRPRRGWMLSAAAAAVVVVVGFAVVFAERGPRQSTVETTDTQDTTTGVVDSFAAALESGHLLIAPSAEDRALASDTSLYEPDESWTQVSAESWTQVSAAGNFVALAQCRSVGECGTSWAYMTGSVDGDEVYRGLLGEADAPEVFVLDDRFFVVVQGTTNAEQQPTAWLIDSATGERVQLTWRDDPTTINSPQQALLVSDGHWSALEKARLTNELEPSLRTLFLPLVVDGRDGTIRPLAVPDNASANLPVMQTGTGRMWIGTVLDGRSIGEEEDDAFQVAGVAYSDDGGATWNHVTVPAELLEGERLTKQSSGLSIAADGDHIAITSTWSYNTDRFVYVSDDAGLTWSVVTVANPSKINGAQLFVLADERLLLLRSDDVYAHEILVSAGADWTTLELDSPATRRAATPSGSGGATSYVSVNPDGTVLMLHPNEDYTGVVLQGGETYVVPFQYRFSTDLRNWRTVPILED